MLSSLPFPCGSRYRFNMVIACAGDGAWVAKVLKKEAQG